MLLQHFPQAVQLILIRLNLFKQRFSIRQTNVAPHFRRAAGDAGEVAEAAAGEAQQVFGVTGAVVEVTHQRKRQQVRQVAGCGEHLVVFIGGHQRYVGAAGLP